MAAGEVDVALVGSSVPEALQDQLVATPYATDELVLVVSRQVVPPLPLEGWLIPVLWRQGRWKGVKGERPSRGALEAIQTLLIPG